MSKHMNEQRQLNVDLFGNPLTTDSVVNRVQIYADEIQRATDTITGEQWLYAGAIYELENNPILQDLIDVRYLKSEDGWEDYFDKNDATIHWSELSNDANKKNIVKRWFEYLLKDCNFGHRKFYFSLLGINLTNLNLSEFDRQQEFNSIYNRFFRTMLKSSLKRLIGGGVVVTNIFHEDGPQSDSQYFDWHTITTLDQDDQLNFDCSAVQFLPKSHRKDERSNLLQLCDVLIGIFKDLHLGVNSKTYPNSKIELLESDFVSELIVNRVIRNPDNINSSYGHARRFNLSLFPRIKSTPGSIERQRNNFYNVKKINLNYYSGNQLPLF